MRALAYSRYAPHREAFAALSTSLCMATSVEQALAFVGSVRAEREAGAPFLVWEWAPDEVLEAWGDPDLVLSNGFFPHYSTVSWDRKGWVATAAWAKETVRALGPEDEQRVGEWTSSCQAHLGAQGGRGTAEEVCPKTPFLLVILQNENDLVARWWPARRGSEWLVQRACAHASGLEVLVKQHPYDPKEPEDYDVDRSRVRFVEKNAIPYAELAGVNHVLLSEASEVWGFNSTVLTEAALVFGVPTRAFGPRLMDGHGVLFEETPVLGAAEAAAGLSSRQRRLALLSRVLGRQVGVERLGEVAAEVLADRELAAGWDFAPAAVGRAS